MTGVLAWGARGPGFKSRQPDQPFQSDAGDLIGSRKATVDDFEDAVSRPVNAATLPTQSFATSLAGEQMLPAEPFRYPT
jgi:hypothetical protein